MRKSNAWIAALGAAVAICATGARAATDTTWNGGSGGTEAAPINFYDSTKWSSGKLPSDAYNLKFSVDAPLVITNTASASTYVADHICFNKGQYTVLGPAKFNGFHEGASESGTVSITKKGDWTTHWYFYPCNTSGSEVVVTNKTGNWIIGGSASDVGMRAPYVASSTFRFVIESGTITLKKTSSIGYKGTGYLELNGGKIQSDSYLNIGSAGTGYMTINGGEFVGASTLKRLAYDTGSKGTLTMNGGKATFSGGYLEIGRKGAGNVIMNGGTLTVNSEKWVYMGRESGSSGNIALNGGTFTAKHIHKGGNGGTITFNGGTLKANASYGDEGGIIQNDTGIKVVVAANGGTIDTGGYNVTYGKNTTTKSGVANDGGLKFQGGGSVTVTGSASNPRLTYNGRTTVAVGTTLKVPTATIGGGFAATIPSGLAEGIYKIVEITGDAAFPDDVLANSELPSDPKARFFLSSDKKAICCAYVDLTDKSVWTGAKDSNLLDGDNWLGGVPTAENGQPAVIGVVSAATLACDDAFSPVSITFLAGSAAVTISGEGSIEGIAAVTNLSAASHTINAPVRFTSGINVKQNAVGYDTIGNSHVTLAGGAYAAAGKTIDADYSVAVFGRYYFANTSAWTATEDDTNGKRKAVAAGSYLYVPLAGNMNNLYVGKGATIDIGKVTHSVSNNRLSWRNYGEMIVTNLTFTGSGDRFVTSHQTDGIGTFKFEAVTCSMSGNWFYLGDATEAGNHVFYIGAGGMKFANASGTPCFSIGRNYAGNTETVRPWYSDFTIADRAGGDYSLVFYRNVTFCTDDENGVGRTITIDAKTRGNGDAGTVNLTVSGSGKVKVNSASSVNIQPAVTVTDTATLAIKPGKGLGESAMTVNSGATLEIPQSGTVTLAGNLTLANGAALAFKLDGDNETTLALASGKTLAATAKVGIKFAEGSFPKPGREYTLVSAANLAAGDEAKFSLPAGDRGALSVKDGKLVYTAPSYFYIRVADNGRFSLKDESDNVINVDIPVSWIYAKTGESDSSSLSAIATTLADPGVNGIAVWKSYCLGLDPQDAASTLLCEAAAGQPSDGKVNIAAKNLNVPAGLSGVAVTAYLDRKNGDGWDLVASAQVTSGSALLAAPAIESGTSFFA